MTDTTPEATPTPEPEATPTPKPEATPTPEPEATPTPEPEQPKPDREAAKYRRQLRETEATASALATRVEAMQRREVERLAGADLATPADLWLTGPELAELLNDDGDVDPDKVTAAVAEVVAARPGWARPLPPPSQDGGARQSPPPRGRSMEDLLRGGARP